MTSLHWLSARKKILRGGGEGRRQLAIVFSTICCCFYCSFFCIFEDLKGGATTWFGVWCPPTAAESQLQTNSIYVLPEDENHYVFSGQSQTHWSASMSSYVYVLITVGRRPYSKERSLMKCCLKTRIIMFSQDSHKPIGAQVCHPTFVSLSQ